MRLKISLNTQPFDSQLNWPPRLVSRQRLLGFSEALIFLSYSGEKQCGVRRVRFQVLSLRGAHDTWYRAPDTFDWLSRAVTLRGLPVISRVLCF